LKLNYQVCYMFIRGEDLPYMHAMFRPVPTLKKHMYMQYHVLYRATNEFYKSKV